MKVKSLITWYDDDPDSYRKVIANHIYDAIFEPKYEQFMLETPAGQVALEAFECEIVSEK